MKIYLAGRYRRREELCGYRSELLALGHQVQARWLDGEHQIANDGNPIGEHGESLVEGSLRSGEVLSETEQTARAATLRAKFARDDWEDVIAAELVISFTEPPRSDPNRGGRHVEYGIALARGARVIIVGHRENIFHWLPQVEFAATWDDAKSCLPSPTDTSSQKLLPMGITRSDAIAGLREIIQDVETLEREKDPGFKRFPMVHDLIDYIELQGFPPQNDLALVVAAFQKAARKVMRRMHENEKYHYLMHGTETYGLILEAFALSRGKTLPDMASMMDVAEAWALLHKD